MINSSATISHNIGKFNVTSIQFEWKIRNFSALGKNTGDQIVSPVFFDSWLLVLCPKGFSQDSEDYVSIFLSNNRSFPVFASFTFTLIDHNGKKSKSSETSKALILKRTPGILKVYGNAKSFKRSLVQNSKNQLLVNDTLTIFCEIKAYQDCISCVSAEKQNAATQTEFAWIDDQESFGKFLNSDKFSDVSFSVSGAVVRAHRNILSARSRVFEAMFDKAIDSDQEIFIENIEHDVFIDLLRFVYTGKVKDIARTTEELLLAASRYEIQALKDTCERAICEKPMKLDDALSYLGLAETCRAERLKRRAMEFIVEKNASVIKSARFAEFARLHSQLAAEVVDRVASVFYEVVDS